MVQEICFLCTYEYFSFLKYSSLINHKKGGSSVKYTSNLCEVTLADRIGFFFFSENLCRIVEHFFNLISEVLIVFLTWKMFNFSFKYTRMRKEIFPICHITCQLGPNWMSRTYIMLNQNFCQGGGRGRNLSQRHIISQSDCKRKS